MRVREFSPHGSLEKFIHMAEGSIVQRIVSYKFYSKLTWVQIHHLDV